MKAISFFLEGISITSSEKTVCEQFRAVLEDVLGDIDDEIKYSNGVIKINTSGSLKSEIFLNKKKILEDFNSKLDGVKISKIY